MSPEPGVPAEGQRNEQLEEQLEAQLEEQRAYYKARAGEYDVVHRRGGYGQLAIGAVLADPALAAERDQVVAAFDRLDIGPEVLELAGGTGIWTERLLARNGVRRVTVVDSSIEMVSATLTKLGDAAGRVAFLVEDIFGFRPARKFDSVVFCYWISHVPRSRLDAFCSMVSSALRPGGTVFFVDDRCPPPGGPRSWAPPVRSGDEQAGEPSVRSGDEQAGEPSVVPGGPAPSDRIDAPDGSRLSRRRTVDGREFLIVKNCWTASELEEAFRLRGVDVAVSDTETSFVYGSGRLR